MHPPFVTLLLAALSSPLSTIATTCGSTNTVTNPTGSGKVMAGWFPGWAAAGDLYKTDWGKYNYAIFAFATTTNDSAMIDITGSGGPPMLTQFVQTARNAKAKASVSVGGWTGSQHFSTLVTSAYRSKFVEILVKFAQTYQLDGLDFDWEYPGLPGACNEYSTDDSANFLALLQDLKKAAPNLILTAAVGTVVPYQKEISGFAKVLDHIAVMGYDYFGQFGPSSTKVGPNAPLTACDATIQAVGSVTSQVQGWISANFPADKIVLAIAGYGHTYTVDPGAAISSSGALNLYPPFTPAPVPAGAIPDACNQVAAVTVIDFDDMITQGYLDAKGSAAPGNTYLYDNCSETPYIYNLQKTTMVSYDDAKSLAAKGRFIETEGLAGFSLWDLTCDSSDILFNAVSGAMGGSGKK